MNLSQLSKGLNLLVYVGYTSTDTMAADLATKFYRGLLATVNSHLWRHGSVDGVIPLLDGDSTFLFTHEGSVVWSGKTEKCNHTTCPEFDVSFCTCYSCNSTFWSAYKPLFCGDMITNADLASDAIVSDESAAVSVVNVNNTPVTAVSDHVSDGAPIAATAEITLVSRENSAATDAGIDPECLFDSVTYSSIFSAGYKCDNAVIDTADNDADLLLVTQPLRFQHDNSYTFFPNPPASLFFDVIDISGADKMSDRWPRVFNALSDRAFVATQQPDGLQIPSDWLNLIHGMPLLSDNYYYHLFS